MTLDAVIVYAWAIGLLIEIALLFRLLWYRVRLPVFVLFLLYDIPRWACMFYVNWTHPMNLPANRVLYTEMWRWTEVPGIALLAAAGLEAWGRLAGKRIPWTTYAVLVAMLLVSGFMVPTTPVPLATLMIPRTFVVFGIAAVLASAIGYRHGNCGLHALLMAAFCTVDVIAYLTIAMDARRIDPQASAARLFLVCGQGLCLLGWLFSVRRIQRECDIV